MTSPATTDGLMWEHPDAYTWDAYDNADHFVGAVVSVVGGYRAHANRVLLGTFFTPRSAQAAVMREVRLHALPSPTR